MYTDVVFSENDSFLSSIYYWVWPLANGRFAAFPIIYHRQKTATYRQINFNAPLSHINFVKVQ